MAEQDDIPQPQDHKRLKPNALRLRQILPDEMEWFMGGAFGVMVGKAREKLITDKRAKTFYGIVDQKCLYPEFDIKTQWHKEDESGDIITAFGSLINQAKKSENDKIRKGGIIADIAKHVGTGKTGVEELVADITGLRHDIVGPATKKNYGKPEMGNISFDCTYDLRAGQMKLASNMIRIILGMVYPSSGEVYMDKDGYNIEGTKNVYDEKTGKLKGVVKVVDAFKSTFGMIRTQNPLPVEVALGQHFYMAPMVINDVKLTSSPDYFSFYEKDDKRSELMHPTWIKVHIELSPYLMPSPAQSWLVYSGYNLMGPDAGEPYKAEPDAI